LSFGINQGGVSLVDREKSFGSFARDRRVPRSATAFGVDYLLGTVPGGIAAFHCARPPGYFLGHLRRHGEPEYVAPTELGVCGKRISTKRPLRGSWSLAPRAQKVLILKNERSKV
jgi:hypothetical protein